MTPESTILGPSQERAGEQKMAKQKSDPRMDALSELHSMLTQSIGAKLKAKKVKTDPIEADKTDEQLGAEGSEDENPGLKAKKKMQFGPGHKK